MKIQYGFDGIDEDSKEIKVYADTCYIIFEQDNEQGFVDCNRIEFKASDIHDLIKALQALVPVK